MQGRGAAWKTATAVAAAGAAAVLFAAPASAETQTVTVTLLGGQQIEVAVDVPAGLPLDALNDLKIPGISTPIISVTPSVTVTPKPAAKGPDARAEAPRVHRAHRQRRSGGRKVVVPLAPAAVAPKRVVKKRHATRFALADGTPRVFDPSYAFAIPGAVPVGVSDFFIDRFRIPPFLLPIYQAAGVQYGIRWELLAAINEIETDYGRNLNVSSAGAVGWMQFLPSTWKRYGVDANGDGKKDPYNPVDAIFTAARYLRAAGAETDIRRAVFAYNHADWYVDSVLMRARLIGGLPADLVGSLTGLTQGHFPVHAVARYADAHRGVSNIYARAGSPAIAVQDGKVVRLGHSKKLGRFVVLRDVYGNTYTYSNLASVARRHLVPRERAESAAQISRALELPAKDPAPSAPATAGSHTLTAATASVVQTAKATTAAVVKDHSRAHAHTSAPAAPVVAPKQRLFAHPPRLHAPKSLAAYYALAGGIDRKAVRIRPLRVGSRVVAGTILGRLGDTGDGLAPHLRFQIRPAGKGAPEIDPKPILDGWKLLESTEIYQAAKRNPFFGPDARNPSIGQTLLMSKEMLAKRVLADPRIGIYPGGRTDIQAGRIDRRVLATLEFLSLSGLKPTVSCLMTGHSHFTTSGNVSEHSSGNAADISAINGIPIIGHQGPGSITDITIRRLLTLQGTMKPHQIISLMTFPGTDNTLALPDHNDHIHVGFRPLFGDNTKTGRQLDQILKPGQWIKLVDRLAKIQNPDILATGGDR